MKNQSIQFELSVTDKEGKDVVGFLKPLTWPVAEVALGYVMKDPPMYLTAGAVIINSLWLRGSTRLQEGGNLFDSACMQAFKMVKLIGGRLEADTITVDRIAKDGTIKKFKCQLKAEVDRNTLEEALGLSAPFVGNPKVLTAGKLVLDSLWLDGDKEIKTDDDLLIPACLAAYRKIEIQKGIVKKV